MENILKGFKIVGTKFSETFGGYDMKLKKFVEIQKIFPNMINKQVLRNDEKIDLFKKIDHKNILKMYNIFDEKRVIVENEYFENYDSLKELLKKKDMHKENVINWFYDIIEGVKVLHSKGLYPTLSPHDILISPNNQLKIRETITKNMIYQSLGIIDKDIIPYTSPELLGSSKESVESSFYSVGMIGYEIFNSYVPFTSTYDVISYGNRPELLPSLCGIDKELGKLIVSLINPSKSERITVVGNYVKPFISPIGSCIFISYL